MSILNIKELFSKKVTEDDNKKLDSPLEDNFSSGGKKSIEMPIPKLSEADAGITEYYSKDIGFQAVIKERFSDFQVHEIDLEGNITHLTSTDLPVMEEEPVNSIDESLLDASTWEQLEKVFKNETGSFEIDATFFEKDKRRDVHKVIKAKYGSKVVSNTAEDGDKKLIVVKHGKSSSDRKDWPSGWGKFLHFVLYKSNLDTIDAINILASKLHTKPANFTYAGTKDKRGKTTQWVSVRYVDAKRLQSINKFLRGMTLGNFVYKEEPLKLGDLMGNHFEVVLRNVTASDEEVEKTLNVIKENYFINYYGLQRFGNSAQVPTHEIGKALVKGDFKRAVELILKPREDRDYNLKEARKIWWETRDAAKAVRVLRSKDKSIEGKLLAGLAKHGKNAYVNALDNIPRNLRLLYLHAYQSFLWNKIVSKRFETFGNQVLEGDLVFKEKEIKEINELDIHEETDDASDNPDVVKCLSKDELGQFKISDIVHPLPGHSVKYPENVIKEWYEALLEEDGLSSDKFKQSVKQFSLSGTYRPIVKKIKDLTWKTVNYSDPKKDLILSDTDVLLNEVDQESEIGDPSGEYKALILSFSLDSSTYATMAFREILRIDTSSSHQTTLNSYSIKRPLDESGCDGDQDAEVDVKRKK